jgi:hypothetical protein
VPEESASPYKLLNTTMAGALELMLSIFGSLGMEWWRGRAEEQGAEKRGSEGARGNSPLEVGSAGRGSTRPVFKYMLRLF